MTAEYTTSIQINFILLVESEFATLLRTLSLPQHKIII